MVALRSLLPALFAVSNTALCLASSWHFTDATVSVQGKAAGAGGSFKEQSVNITQLLFPS